MPRIYTSKYADFTVSEPILRRSKFPPYDEKSYIQITCPHCQDQFDVAADAIASKAARCIEHLRQCSSYTGQVSEAPAKKRKTTNDDLLSKLNEVTEKLNEMHEEQRATFQLVHESSGRGPPPPTSKEELASNIQRDREEREQLTARFNAHLCSVCMDNLSQRLLFPCHHMCMCNSCAQQTQEREGNDFRCPICRIGVEGTLAIPGL